jgi:K+-sensing histidine kinase KdpD
MRRATEGTAEFAESREVRLNRVTGDTSLVLADENLLVRALQALLETAVKFSEKGGTVRLSGDVGPDKQRVIIESQGRNIPGPALAKFFDLFSIGEALTPGGDLGVGPPLAYRIVSLFGGSVSVANRNRAGIRLTITLRNAASNNGDPS